MLAAEKHKATFVAPVGVGLALFITQITGVYYTGAGVNPARAFGPDVVNASFPGYHWIYWVGPLLGSIISSIFYYIFKYLRYQTANPGQDSGNEEICLLYNNEETALAADPERRKLLVFHLHSTSAGPDCAVPISDHHRSDTARVSAAANNSNVSGTVLAEGSGSSPA